MAMELALADFGHNVVPRGRPERRLLSAPPRADKSLPRPPGRRGARPPLTPPATPPLPLLPLLINTKGSGCSASQQRNSSRQGEGHYLEKWLVQRKLAARPSTCPLGSLHVTKGTHPRPTQAVPLQDDNPSPQQPPLQPPLEPPPKAPPAPIVVELKEYAMERVFPPTRHSEWRRLVRLPRLQANQVPASPFVLRQMLQVRQLSLLRPDSPAGQSKCERQEVPAEKNEGDNDVKGSGVQEETSTETHPVHNAKTPRRREIAPKSARAVRLTADVAASAEDATRRRLRT